MARFRNRPKDAESWLKKALAVAQDNADVQRAWARYQWIVQNFPAAEAAFSTAIRLDPKAASTYTELGDFYLTALKKPWKAAHAYREALKRDHASATIHRKLGTALVALRQMNEAAAAFQQAAKLAPGDPEPLQALGQLYLVTRNLDKAQEAFTLALQAHADYPPALTGRGDMYMAKGEMEKAIADYARVAQLAPTSMQAHFKLALAYHESARWAEAEKAYRAAIAANPNHPAAYNNLAWLLAQNGQRLDEALKLIRKAIQLAPDAGAFHDTLGAIHLRRGDLDAAIAAFEKAAATQPPQADFYYRLGIAHSKKGNRAEAIAALRKALVLRSDFSNAAEARRELQRLEGG